MITIYDLLEIDENASKEDIEKAYQKLVLKYHTTPNLDTESNSDNEMILNKLKIAYEILSDDEKRKKYDKDLANKRAEDLIKNVSVSHTETTDNTENNTESNSVENNKTKYKVVKKENINNNSEVDLSKDEKNKIKKAAQNEFKENLKKAQKAEEEYNKAYNEAYNDYLRKIGYKVKEPWTWKRIKNLLITIVAIIIVCFLVWIIPPTRNILINIYKENFIIKSLVDIVVTLFNSILKIFK